MGQKVDARVFRQSLKNKNWEFKYIEKNNEDSSLFLYKILQIQNYLNRFFSIYKIEIHNCKIFYSSNTLQIFISFYVTRQTITIVKKKLCQHFKILRILQKFRFSKKTKKRKKKHKLRGNKISWKRNIQKKIIGRRKTLQTKKKVYLSKKYEKTLMHKTQTLKWSVEFQEILLESLAMYTKNNATILVTLQNFNLQKQFKYLQIKNFKIVFKHLKKFVKHKFFKEAINILFINFSKRKSAKLLADFLSNQLRLNHLKSDQTIIKKKDNYFLGFLKQALSLLIKSEIAFIKGLKIVIKGRFNRAPRAKTNIIQYGNIPLHSLNCKIDYYSSIAYTMNGTFGVKVWLCENI